MDSDDMLVSSLLFGVACLSLKVLKRREKRRMRSINLKKYRDEKDQGAAW
jgi:hypothetical protein